MVTSSGNKLHNPFGSHVGYHLRRASNAVMSELALRLDSVDLKISEASILLLIEANPRATQSELGRELGIKRANMVPLAAGLEARNLIVRKQVDGRSHGFELTKLGRDKCDDARMMMTEQEHLILNRLNGDFDEARRMLANLWA